MELKAVGTTDARFSLIDPISLNSRSLTYSTFKNSNNENIILYFKVLVNILGSSRSMQPLSAC